MRAAIAIFFLVLLGFVAYAPYRVYRGMPDLDAILTSPALQAEVRVVRDTWGVPHIQATSESDAFFALGYCMAQDRLFQMELMRRIARGELAEVLGPPAVPADRILRAFRLRAKAEESVAAMETRFPVELRTAIEAYLSGINKYITEEPLPWEFAALAISCRPFTKADCLAVAAVMPITFADGLRTDPLKTMLKQEHPDLDVDLLFRGIEETPVTIMGSLDATAAFQRERLAKEALPPATAEALDGAAQWLDAIAAHARRMGTHLGSNSWVLSGDKTASGKPILANDPHIGFTNPSVWYEAHIDSGDFALYGYYLPPIPFALIGHNKACGWGLTMFANDDVDLYLEKVNPENPNQVMYRGEWVDCEIQDEVIHVRLAEDIVCPVRLTPHGPIINDLLGTFFDYDGPPVALRWIWQNVAYTDVEAVYEMGHARDYESFAAAVTKITSPGLNISYADAAGNIAWWAAGLLPIRPPHVDPKALLEGWTGRDEIEGYLPVTETPHLKNPPSGMIVTANNVTTLDPVGTPPKQIPRIQGYFKPGDRAGRIEELLAKRDDWDLESLEAVQTDDTGYAPRHMAPALVQLARQHEERLDPTGREALSAVAQWDFRHDSSSLGATVFHYWIDSLLVAILSDELSEEELKLYATVDDHWIALQDLLANPGADWWDDITTPEREDAAAIATRALQHACTEITRDLGANPAGWRWGRAHTITFTHPFGYVPGLGMFFNIGPFPSSGAGFCVNNMLSKSLHDYRVIAGPSTRRLIDFAHPEESLTVLPTGNSGHIFSPHYDDQAPLFVHGKYRPALLDWTAIEAAKRHEMRLLPD